MLSTTDTHLINDLICVCQDGQQFYRHAAKEVGDNDLKSLFREMAAIRADIADDLTKKAQAIGMDTEEGTSVAGTMRTLYTDIRNQLSDHPNLEYVSKLEASEDKALRTFREDIRKVSSPLLASEIARHLATIQITHDRMKQIKEDLKAVKH